MDFDAIVIGSGISGGWAAKELCERGMRTLLIERGRHVTHKTDYQDFAAPWELAHRGQVPEDEARRDYAIQSTCYAFNSATRQWWVKDSEHPYLTPEGREFLWLRGYHLGGRSLTWARQTYRFSDIDFARQPAKTATASTGRFATPTFHRGTTTSNPSPAFPAATKDSSSCPTAVF